MAENSKYVPLKDASIGGIIVMRYSGADQSEDLVEPVAGKMHSFHLVNVILKFCFDLAMGPKVEEENEPEPPEPFEYNED